MAAEQAMLMREVDDAVRQDQVGTVAKKYGLVIGGAVVLILALFGGWLFWQSRSEDALETRSEDLVTAIDELEAGNERAADGELAALADAGPAAAASARLLRAGLAAEQMRPEDAIKLYDEVAADTGTPQAYRDFAAIRSAALGFDKLQPQQVIDRIGPLAVPENAWYGSAGELVALAYLQQDKPDQAGPLLAAIAKNENVPQSLRARTRQLAGLLGFDAVEDPEATLANLSQDGTAEQGPANPATGAE